MGWWAGLAHRRDPDSGDCICSAGNERCVNKGVVGRCNSKEYGLGFRYYDPSCASCFCAEKYDVAAGLPAVHWLLCLVHKTFVHSRGGYRPSGPRPPVHMPCVQIASWGREVPHFERRTAVNVRLPLLRWKLELRWTE